MVSYNLSGLIYCLDYFVFRNCYTVTSFSWTNIGDYIDYYKQQPVLSVFSKIVYDYFQFGIHDIDNGFMNARPLKERYLQRLQLYFSIMFALVSSMHYFVQISFVRFAKCRE